jgi:hypothetical protein
MTYVDGRTRHEPRQPHGYPWISPGHVIWRPRFLATGKMWFSPGCRPVSVARVRSVHAVQSCRYSGGRRGLERGPPAHGGHTIESVRRKRVKGVYVISSLTSAKRNHIFRGSGLPAANSLFPDLFNRGWKAAPTSKTTRLYY